MICEECKQQFEAMDPTPAVFIRGERVRVVDVVDVMILQVRSKNGERVYQPKRRTSEAVVYVDVVRR